MVVELHLGDPSFTILHSAGVAGLWMTLNQLEREKVRPSNINWKLEQRKVTLSWQGNDLEVLDWLLTESFQVYKGMIAFRGLDSKTMPLSSQIIMHEGVLGTFLQLANLYKSGGIEKHSFQIEEGKPELVVQYKTIESYPHQSFAKELCDRQGQLYKTPIRIKGWLNPGAAVRHYAFEAQTSFEESPANALALLFAPVACSYFRLRSYKEKKTLFALVIPQVTDLLAFSTLRQQDKQRELGYQKFFASGTGDAGLRFLVDIAAADTANTYETPRCQVVTLGSVAWSEQQKTRTEIRIVEATPEVCHNYKVADAWLPDKYFTGENGCFIKSSFARELVADNLTRSRPWYFGLSTKVNNENLFQQLSYERGGLYSMVQNTQWDSKTEQLFVQACHEALSRIYGQAKEQANDNADKQKADDTHRQNLIQKSFEKEAIKIRSALARCKNAKAFRLFIANFWNKAGRVPTFAQNSDILMELISPRGDWRTGRDLALLSLVSYKGTGKFKLMDNSESNSDEYQDENDDPLDY